MPAAPTSPRGIIRPAEIRDLEALQACAHGAYSLYVPRMDQPPAPMSADYRALILDHLVWSLDCDGEVVGFIVLYLRDDHVFLENLAVHPDHQGAGFGRRLVAFAETYAVATGRPRIELYTNIVMTENLVFYDRLGYEVTERRVEEEYHRIYLAKALEATSV